MVGGLSCTPPPGETAATRRLGTFYSTPDRREAGLVPNARATWTMVESRASRTARSSRLISVG